MRRSTVSAFPSPKRTVCRAAADAVFSGESRWLLAFMCSRSAALPPASFRRRRRSCARLCRSPHPIRHRTSGFVSGPGLGTECSAGNRQKSAVPGAYRRRRGRGTIRGNRRGNRPFRPGVPAPSAGARKDGCPSARCAGRLRTGPLRPLPRLCLSAAPALAAGLPACGNRWANSSHSYVLFWLFSHRSLYFFVEKYKSNPIDFIVFI